MENEYNEYPSDWEPEPPGSVLEEEEDYLMKIRIGIGYEVPEDKIIPREEGYEPYMLEYEKWLRDVTAPEEIRPITRDSEKRLMELAEDNIDIRREVAETVEAKQRFIEEEKTAEDKEYREVLTKIWDTQVRVSQFEFAVWQIWPEKEYRTLRTTLRKDAKRWMEELWDARDQVDEVVPYQQCDEEDDDVANLVFWFSR